jgi:hypothetical protein
MSKAQATGKPFLTRTGAFTLVPHRNGYVEFAPGVADPKEQAKTRRKLMIDMTEAFKKPPRRDQYVCPNCGRRKSKAQTCCTYIAENQPELWKSQRLAVLTDYLAGMSLTTISHKYKLAYLPPHTPKRWRRAHGVARCHVRDGFKLAGITVKKLPETISSGVIR